MQKKIKQLSFLSVIIFTIGATIGAGIFFKNKELNKMAGGDLTFVLSAWAVAVFGILMLGLALVEISSAQKSNRGFLEWTKTFTNNFLHKGSVRFIKFFYLPLSLFGLSIYAVSSFEDGGLELKNGWLVIALSFCIFLWFAGTSILSINFQNRQQWVFTFLQIIPLIFLPIVGFFFSNLSGGNTFQHKIIDNSAGNFISNHKWLIVIAGIPAITFAYDGFYLIFSMKEELDKKANKNLGFAVLISLMIITALYLILSISFAYGSNDGTHFGLNFANSDIWLKVMNILIGIGILSIINGFAMSSPLQIKSLMENGEANWLLKVKNKLFMKNNSFDENDKNYLTAWLYMVFSTLVFFIIFGLIAVYYPKDTWDFDTYGSGTYVYSFADVIQNYLSLVIFLIIAIAIFGGVINRFKNKITVDKKWYFIPAGIISFIFYSVAFCYTIISAILNMTGYNGANIEESVIQFSVFTSIILLSFLPGIVEYFINKFSNKKLQKAYKIKE